MKNIFTTLLIFFALVNLNAQHLITGKVTDITHDELVGVNVLEIGTNIGTTTDFDGNYSLMVSSPNASIEFSYVGYSTVTYEIDGQTELNVTLQSGVQLGEVQIVGTRSYNRSITDSPVAIDMIDIADLASSTGKAEINEILQYAAPSFNATKQSGSDGSDHIDPASLRGLGPDQTLVLINGKRRHQSSLINVFGTRGRGNTGTDLNAIPASAIKRIEVLRDGASAQYGSDAIAGVINIVLKDQTDVVTGGITYGAYSTAVGDGYAEKSGETIYNVEGENRAVGEEEEAGTDGTTIKVDLNYGVDIGDQGGHANFTAEYLSKDRTLRPGYPWRKGYGSAAINSFNFMVNGAIPVGDNTEIYGFGGRNFRDTDAFAFSRDTAYFKDGGGDERAVASLYPDGFTPRITSSITDGSFSAGVRHDLSNGWKVDFSNSYGKNDFHYFIKETNNASLLDASPTDFDAGGHSLAQNTTGLDFSKYYDKVTSGLNLAFGMEYRTENFKIYSGQEASYATYDVNGEVATATTDPADIVYFKDRNGDLILDDDGNRIVRPGGSQGFPGYSPSNEVDEDRTNFGFYVDAELKATEAFLLGAALRYERYSDFGETINFKFATRYKVNNNLTVRGSVSSGFRAPSLAQIHYNLTFNNIVAGGSVRTLLAPNTSTVTRAFGIEELKQETALNASLGFTLRKGGFTATIDAYTIAVDDRIILTDNFDATGFGIGIDAAQFFANGVDTRTSGADIVLNYKYFFTRSNAVTVGLVGNVNTLEIDKIHNGDLNEFTFFGPFSQAYLEAAAPDYKFGLNLGYSTQRFDALLSITQFSEIILQDFRWVDSPATTQAEADDLFPKATDTYEAAMTIDFSLAYTLTKNLKVTIGANNLLNTYPTPQYDGWTDQGGFNDSVQMGSDGSYYFGRLGLTF